MGFFLLLHFDFDKTYNGSLKMKTPYDLRVLKMKNRKV